MVVERKLLLFGLGAQKAGTTWLQAQLSGQADTYFSLPKELHYWDCVRAPFLQQFKLAAYKRRNPRVPHGPFGKLKAHLDPKAKENHQQALRYQRIFDGKFDDHSAYLDYAGVNEDAAIVGDITPSYALLGRETFNEMYACQTRRRPVFLFIMRDPIERLWSGLGQRFRAKLATGELDLDRRAKFFQAAARNSADPDFLRSDYRRTITELEAGVPEHNICYVFFETLFSGDATEMSNLSRALNLPKNRFQVTQRVHTGSSPDPLPVSVYHDAKQAFANIYGFIEEKFGDRVPSKWGRAPTN